MRIHGKSYTGNYRRKSVVIQLKLQNALKGVNGQIKSTQSQLKDVNKLLKLDPGNTELLAQKHKLLAEAVGETKEKADNLKDSSRTGKYSTCQWRNLTGTV